MPGSRKVEIDSSGQIRPPASDQVEPIPAGGALLIWPSPADEAILHLSESALASDWLRPEEDAAWAHLQPDK